MALRDKGRHMEKVMGKNAGATCASRVRHAERLSRELIGRLHAKAVTAGKNDTGQGTTEYAILVGVLVVIAIVAIVAFRPKLQELWNAIAEGMGQL